MIAILTTLEQKVLQELRNAVEESKIKSKHTGQKTLPVSLEDLIDIINDLKN